jgi:hypothetical protein
MKLFTLLLLLLTSLFSATLSAAEKETPILLAMADDLDDDLDDDPMAEDDPMADSEDSDDPLSDSNDEASESVEHYPKVKSKNIYRVALGAKNITMKGFATGSASEDEEKAALVNAFNIHTQIIYSEDVSLTLNLGLTFLQEYDQVQERYTDEGTVQVNESFLKVDRGDYTYKVGALLFNNGPLDLDSPSNVLTMGNTVAYNSFDINNLNRPFIGGQYAMVGESSTLTATLSLLKPETAGTEYTRYVNEISQRDSGEQIQDYSELSAHAGLRYTYNFSAFNLGIASYYWYDRDTQINWVDASESTSLTPNAAFSSTYSEKVTNTAFSGIDFDMSLGSFVLKGESYYFVGKNIYSFLRNNFNENEFSTFSTDMISSAVSLEKISGDLFLMGVYSHKKLYDVPANTNILGFENETILPTVIRDLEYHQVSIVANYTINDRLKALLSLSQALIVQQTTLVSALDYKLSSNETLGLKAIYLDAEEHLSTSSKLNTQQLFVDYVYQF